MITETEMIAIPLAKHGVLSNIGNGAHFGIFFVYVLHFNMLHNDWKHKGTVCFSKSLWLPGQDRFMSMKL